MRRIRIYLPALILLAIVSSALNLKNIADDLATRVFGYYHEKIGNTLFLHTDKSIYIPNESIWFKAYVLNGFLQNEVLYLRLLDEKKQIVLQKEFEVYDIRAHGDMLIPATTSPGNYTIVAYTDKMINFDPEAVFIKQIKVIKDQSSDLKAEALITDSTSFSAGKTPEVMIRVSGANNREVARARGTYKIYTADNKIIADGKFLTGPTGVALVRFKYPDNIAQGPLFFSCNVTDKQQSKDLTVKLPQKPAIIVTEFYAEGGHLISGTSNRILVTTTDITGAPVSAKVILKDQDKPITLATTNTEGLGIINFTPNLNSKYTLTISNAGYVENKTFPLNVDKAGYVMQLTGPPDHRAVVVKNQNMPGNVTLLGKTLSELKINRSLTIKSGDSVRISLPQNDSINHVVDLGLFDDNQQLLSERLVYLPVPEKYHIAVTYSKPGYTQREKVRADITVTDANGQLVPANLSAAVVAAQTIDPSVEPQINQTDLYALQHRKFKLPETGDINDELIRENIRFGNWANVISYQPKDSIKTLANTAGVFGYITSKKAKQKIALKKLYLYSKNSFAEIPVSKGGTFSISAEDLLRPQGDDPYLIVNKEFNDIYDLHIKNYAADFDGKIILTDIGRQPITLEQARYSPQLTAIMSGKVLKEVVIKGTKIDQNGDINLLEYHSPHCNDYVCFYNILNCTNHTTGGTPPIEGAIYIYNGRPIRYHGCVAGEKKPNSYKIKHIDLSREFYLPDYEKEPIPTPELQSTIFWKPNINTQSTGKSTIEFYTSDIEGDFSIIIQGLTVNGLVPVYGKSTFKVILKK